MTFPRKLRDAKAAIAVLRQSCGASLSLRHRRLRDPPTKHRQLREFRVEIDDAGRSACDYFSWLYRPRVVYIELNVVAGKRRAPGRPALRRVKAVPRTLRNDGHHSGAKHEGLRRPVVADNFQGLPALENVNSGCVRSQISRTRGGAASPSRISPCTVSPITLGRSDLPIPCSRALLVPGRRRIESHQKTPASRRCCAAPLFRKARRISEASRIFLTTLPAGHGLAALKPRSPVFSAQHGFAPLTRVAPAHVGARRIGYWLVVVWKPV